MYYVSHIYLHACMYRDMLVYINIDEKSVISFISTVLRYVMQTPLILLVLRVKYTCFPTILTP